MSNPFDRNPYRLPPPWNAGYALPQNVDDEGLERHAYTTAWAPRGSYDDPKVGTAGYAVPQYVKDEGYGRGAMITRWAQRGTYAGPKVVHWLDKPPPRIIAAKALPGGAAQIQLATMAGVETANAGAARFTAYGVKAARALLDTVKMMPPDLRVKQLRKALDKIDPRLYGRAEEAASLESKSGVPASVALERGLAVAMSVGIANELVDLGKGKAPPKRSQLGAVCYGCAMLGQTVLSKTSLLSSALAPTLLKLATTTTTTAAPPAGSYPPSDGFCWIPATNGTPAHWERIRAGEVSCSYQPPAGGRTTNVGTNGASGGVTVTDSTTGNVITTPVVTATPTPTPADQKFLNIGPFMIPVSVGAWRDHRALPAEQKAYVDQNIAIAAKAGGTSLAEMKTGRYPFVKFKANGENWGLFYTETSDGTIVAYHKVAANLSGVGSYRSLGGVGDVIGDIGGAIRDSAEYVGGAIADLFSAIWDGITWAVAKYVDFIEDAAKWVADKACDLFTSPVGQIAGAAAGAYVGGPAGAQMGAQGAQIAAQACSPTPTPGPATPAPEQSNLLPLLLLGGAGIAAVLMFSGRKKA